MHSLYELYTRWHQLVLKFPKAERYSLGQTCQQYLLQVLEFVLAASCTSEPERKRTQLMIASNKLDTLRLLVRLCKDCDCLTNNAYLEIEAGVHKTGKMLGGWIKSIHK